MVEMVEMRRWWRCGDGGDVGMGEMVEMRRWWRCGDGGDGGDGGALLPFARCRVNMCNIKWYLCVVVYMW